MIDQGVPTAVHHFLTLEKDLKGGRRWYFARLEAIRLNGDSDALGVLAKILKLCYRSANPPQQLQRVELPPRLRTASAQVVKIKEITRIAPTFNVDSP